VTAASYRLGPRRSQITLTLGTYTHVVPELARDAANRMGSTLWG
jgi:integrase